ncbi:MAG: amino acid aminotransferase [Maricaulaceae bacterium]
MFDALQPRPADAIMALMEMCKADPNPNKIDLGVGVYKDELGRTTILDTVKKAEALWFQEEETKSYIGTVGNKQFSEHMMKLILGDDHAAVTEGRIGMSQTAGGSGALRMAGELINEAAPDITLWASTPTWANHIPLITSAGVKMDSYPYYNRETLSVDFDDMIAHLNAHAVEGDAVLLHGCCHNPTGADLTEAQWDELAQFLADKKLVPFVDLAYFGLGKSLEDDVYGLRRLVDLCPEVIIAASCSKNFALYRERVGVVAVVTHTPERAEIITSQFGSIQRRIISMPPDHGAALVARILGDDTLKAEWMAEVSGMCARIINLRGNLADAMNVQGGELISRAVRSQKGMFSTLPLSKEQAELLRSRHSVYVTNSGRMNMAGLNMNNIPRLAEALLDVI